MLQKASEEHAVNIHAFCLMSNHIHLVMEPTTIALSSMVHAFAGRYARYYNRRHQLRGHLFQDRFRSILVQDSSYLVRLVRYIHLNPVRAHMVVDPLHYLWSSFGNYLGLRATTWLTSDRVLANFGTSNKSARQSLIEYTARKCDAEFDTSLVQKAMQLGAFGTEEFVDEVMDAPSQRTVQPTIELSLLMDVACKKYNFSYLELASSSRKKDLVDARAVLALAVRQNPHLSLRELANKMERNHSSVSRLAQRAQESRVLSEQADLLLVSTSDEIQIP